METEVYQLFSEIQTTHWWFVARRIIVEDVLRGHLLSAATSTFEARLQIADIGCGTGAMLPMLGQFGEAWGVDRSAIALELCHQKNLPNAYQEDDPAWRQRQFDVLTFFDVIEHVDDDEAFLESYLRHLKPGGLVVITVPALMFLWSDHDRLNHHRRRYTARQLQKVVEQAGLVPQKISYFNTWLFPAIVTVRLAARLRSFLTDCADRWLGGRGSQRLRHGVSRRAAARTDFERNIGFMNGLLKAILASERFVLRHGSFALGASLICLAHKERPQADSMAGIGAASSR